MYFPLISLQVEATTWVFGASGTFQGLFLDPQGLEQSLDEFQWTGNFERSKIVAPQTGLGLPEYHEVYYGTRRKLATADQTPPSQQ